EQEMKQWVQARLQTVPPTWNQSVSREVRVTRGELMGGCSNSWLLSLYVFRAGSDAVRVLAVSSVSLETLPSSFAAAPHPRHCALALRAGGARQAAEPPYHLGRRGAGAAAVGAAGDVGFGVPGAFLPLPPDLWEEQRPLALRPAGRLDRLGLPRPIARGERR